MAGYRDLRGFAVTGLPLSSVLLGEQPRLPFTARVERAQFHRGGFREQEGHLALPPSLPSLLVFPSREGGLLDLQLRASNEHLLSVRVARAREINRLPSPPLSCGSIPAYPAGSTLPASTATLPFLLNP